MRLSNELLLEILRCLDYDSLVALQMSNTAVRSLVVAKLDSLAEFPYLRYVRSFRPFRTSRVAYNDAKAALSTHISLYTNVNVGHLECTSMN